uniref:Secreted protein n=1 Tax=Rhipicephalus appendiculatus TaxID=34631 RepID=A0A131YCH9_RHIAP
MKHNHSHFATGLFLLNCWLQQMQLSNTRYAFTFSPCRQCNPWILSVQKPASKYKHITIEHNQCSQLLLNVLQNYSSRSLAFFCSYR